MPKTHVVLMTFSLIVSSCVRGQPISWDPHFYFHNYQKQTITDKFDEQIKCSDPRFNDYLSMSMEKVLELNDILTRARLPKHLEAKRLEVLQELHFLELKNQR